MTETIDCYATVFHADLSQAYDGEDYWVRAAGGNHPLQPHTDASRAQARIANPKLADIPDHHLTHFTQVVMMPRHSAVRVHIKHSANTLDEFAAPSVPSHAAIYVPPRAEDASDDLVLQEMINHKTTAMALAYSHPQLVTRNPDVARALVGFMTGNLVLSDMFDDLGTLMRELGTPTTTEGEGWATLVHFQHDADPNVTATTPRGVTKSYPEMNSYFVNPCQQYMDAAGDAQTNLMLLANSDPSLEGTTWRTQAGQSIVAANPTPSADPAPAPKAAAASPSKLASVAVTQDDDWTVALTNTQRTSGLKIEITDIQSDKKQFTVNFDDVDLRYLGYYVRFLDAEGNEISLKNWTPVGEDTLTSLTYDIRKVLGHLIEYDTVQFIGYTSGVTTIVGVPTVHASLDVTMQFPEGAVSAEVFGSGLGLCGEMTWGKTPLFGGALTALMDMIVPVVMLAGMASNMSNAGTQELIDKELKGVWKTALAKIIYYLSDAVYGLVADKEIDWGDVASIANVLFSPISFEILVYVEAEMLVEEAAEEIPFAGWAFFALSLSVGVAQITQTVVEMTTSPWNITSNVKATITSEVTVNPDPQAGVFPAMHPDDEATVTVRFIYKSDSRPTVTWTQTYDTTPTELIIAEFPNNTLGGEFKIEVSYYINSWTAAQATTGWLDNNEADAAEVAMYLVENPIPLDANSIYTQTSLLTYQNGNYQWDPTDQNPQETLGTSLNSGATGNHISVWSGLSFSQRFGALGFAWRAACLGVPSASGGTAQQQLSVMQNVDIPGTIGDDPGDPMAGAAFPTQGFEGLSQVVYDPYPPKFLMDDNGQWVLNPPITGTPVPDPDDVSLGDYYVDPRKALATSDEGGGYHLRAITLGGESVTIDTSDDLPSWGRFSLYPDSMVIHPAGKVVAVNQASAKLSITQIPDAGVADTDLPFAVDFAGQSFDADRVGLLIRPVAVTRSSDGTILVLESSQGGTNSGLALPIPAIARIQAFDINGNPVNRFFDESGLPTPFLPIEGVGDYTYLDISAVGDQKMTYMFVLYYTGDGASPDQYNMAIYQYGEEATSENPLVTTNGMAAAALYVDMWHDLYTLNFANVTDGNGTVAGPAVPASDNGGTAGVRTLPSVSQWLPPIPES